jgi:hypothetical protein
MARECITAEKGLETLHFVPISYAVKAFENSLTVLNSHFGDKQ